MIIFNDVSKVYAGGSVGLKDITVTIKNGEFVFLIGKSGAGKSTFLNLVTRAIKPSKGKVMVDDLDLAQLEDSQLHHLRRMVGVIFQDFKVLPDRTVKENVSVGLEILGKSEEEVDQEVADILELVGLSDKTHFFPRQLSAGEVQRVSMARAIVGGPQVLLADEPTGNLDPQTASGIMDILHEINKIGTTVIVATHNDALVNKLGKRTITLHNGRIVNEEKKGKYYTHVSKKPAKKEKKKT